MESVTQHEIAWTLIKKGRTPSEDQIVSIYENHSDLRARLTELNKRFPNQFTISSIHFYPTK